MRSEKRKRILVYLMALALVLSIPAVYIRFSFCVRKAEPLILEELTGAYGTICDRDGNVIYDRDGAVYDEFYNIIDGTLSNGKKDSHYTLAHRFGKELAARSFSVVAGAAPPEEALDGANMVTTLLPGENLVKLREAFGTYEGSVFAYNYKTGEVYVMLSLPSVSPEKAPGGRSKSEILGTFQPGSCFKVIAAACALSQNPDLRSHTYTCTGTHSLGDGTTVTCGYVHNGPLTLSDAIGKSCNCYFASLIQQFDVAQTRTILNRMGITVRTLGTKVPTKTIDRIPRDTSSTVFGDSERYADVWSMIGEIDNTSNLLELACLAGAIANGGSSADPYMVESLYNPSAEEYTYQAEQGRMLDLMDAEAAEATDRLWSTATEKYYRSGKNQLDPRISHGKTGTSEIGQENNRLILCVMEEYDTAFVVAVNKLPSGNALVVDIANVVAGLIPAPTQ